MRAALIALLLMFASQAGAGGTTLNNENALRVCALADMDWINFCNGFIQAAADYSTIAGRACIPEGISRNLMVKLFTTDGLNYSSHDSALTTAVQIISNNFPC
jgi:hypothetical protein